MLYTIFHMRQSEPTVSTRISESAYALLVRRGKAKGRSPRFELDATLGLLPTADGDGKKPGGKRRRTRG